MRASDLFLLLLGRFGASRIGHHHSGADSQASLAVVIPMTRSEVDAARLAVSLERWNNADFAPCRAVGIATVSLYEGRPRAVQPASFLSSSSLVPILGVRRRRLHTSPRPVATRQI